MMHRRFLFGGQNVNNTVPPTPPYTFTAQTELRSTQSTIFDYYGRVVALSTDGLILVVGSDETSLSGINGTAGPGRVYVYRCTKNTLPTLDTWTLVATLVASDGVINDSFGKSVAVSADGNTIVVGAPGAKISSNIRQGAAYVYTFNTAAGTWIQTTKLLASDGTTEDTFGYTVAISGSGTTIASGAIKDDILSTYSVGSVYVYTLTTAWSQLTKLYAYDCKPDDNFGCSISITTNGEYIAIGSYGSDVGIYPNAGAVYYYTKQTSGTSVTYPLSATSVTKISANDKESNNGFGFSLSMNSSGNVMVVGAPFYTLPSSTFTGSITGTTLTVTASTSLLRPGQAITGVDSATISAGFFVPGDQYKITTIGTTDFTAIGAISNTIGLFFTASGIGTGTGTAQRVVTAGTVITSILSGTGMIGTYSINNSQNISSTTLTASQQTNAGSAYIYIKTNSVWAQRLKLLARDGLADDKFGYSVAVSSTSNFVTVGAPGDDGTPGESGSTYVYYNGGTGWAQTTKFTASTAASGDQFGYSVAMTPDATTFAMGAPTNSEPVIIPTPPNSTRIHGAVYVFTRP